MPKSLSIVIMAFMVLASVLAMMMKPNQKLAEAHQQLELAHVIPTQFADWRILDAAAPLVNPQIEEAVNKIYAETLSRTYVNSKGDLIMLSVAYGEDQSDSVGVHLPEGCYGGQGFSITNVNRIHLKTRYADIPATQLLATKGNRVEPITYWLRTGNQITYPGWATKRLKLRYGIGGVIPDGLLLRVSSITSDVEAGYRVQTEFVESLLSSLAPEQRLYLVGYE